MVKPIKILLFLCLIMIILLGISWIVPLDGFKVGKFTLRYPSNESIQNKLMGKIAEKKVPIQQNENTIVAQIDSSKLMADRGSDSIVSPLGKSVDTIVIAEQSIPITPELLKERVIPIEFADSNKLALRSFFKSLVEGNSKTGQVRVLHFGDSQIEGDRITMFIRSALQEKFGGNGVGIIPGYPQSYQPLNVKHSVSGDWRYTSLLDGGNDVSQFGLLGGVTQIDDGSEGEKIEFKKVGKDLRSNKFKKLRVFFGQNDSTYVMQLGVNDEVVDAEMLTQSNSIAEHNFTIPQQAKEVELEFTGRGPLTIYGVSMESDKGIYVDNIPQRGCSGAVFTKFNQEFASKIFSILNVKFVILQYGVNVVPGNLDDYKYYEEILYRQIKAIKTFKPDVSVILIGVSDMSRKADDKFESYPSIEKVRNAQRNAAFRAGAAFWDCYRAMGGQNSMPEWVFANPPLAAKDFTHFNFRGSKLIAEMFIASLLEEYNSFVNLSSNGSTRN